jgi:hypothetical protein
MDAMGLADGPSSIPSWATEGCDGKVNLVSGKFVVILAKEKVSDNHIGKGAPVEFVDCLPYKLFSDLLVEGLGQE